MSHILTKLKTKFGLNGFFSDEYLCKSDIARDRFTRALKEAREYYRKEKSRPLAPALVHDCWKENIAALESYFIDSMDEGFLSNETINGTMVFTDKKAHTIELDDLTRLMDRTDLNRIISKGLNKAFVSGKSHKGSSINSVHHLYHLTRFERATGRKINSIKSVVEFGGGYGNMGRIMQNAGALETYSIIDLLLFSCVQYVFLSTATEAGQVAFCNSPQDRQTPLFTLYPLTLMDNEKGLRGDMFLSTWALSESTRAAYDLVTQRDWFGASNLLIAYNDKWKPWNDGELAASLKQSGWRTSLEAIDFLPESFYLFATR
jgi:hypothetical protein